MTEPLTGKTGAGAGGGATFSISDAILTLRTSAGSVQYTRSA